MKVLIITAHPLPGSLCSDLARRAEATLGEAGHHVVREDLYERGFSPVLTPTERASYYGPAYNSSAVADETRHLAEADALVLVFPTWWFGFPAILKGWFDRVWGPGIAYDHATDLGRIQPRLDSLRHVLAITTVGSPWWVDWLVMRRPVRRVLKTALLGTCAPRCHFEMLSLYRAEKPTAAAVNYFVRRMECALGDLDKKGSA